MLEGGHGAMHGAPGSAEQDARSAFYCCLGRQGLTLWQCMLHSRLFMRASACSRAAHLCSQELHHSTGAR